MAELTPAEMALRPVTTGEWPDRGALFAEPGPPHGCFGMYWRLRRSDFHRRYGGGLKEAMRAIIEAGRVPGLPAGQQGRPIGWCSIAPRQEFGALERSRTLKRVDEQPVWSLVCFFLRRPYGGRGLSLLPIEAAIAYAAAQGARVIETCSLVEGRGAALRYAGSMGLLSTWERGGFREVARRSPRRAVGEGAGGQAAG